MGLLGTAAWGSQVSVLRWLSGIPWASPCDFLAHTAPGVTTWVGFHHCQARIYHCQVFGSRLVKSTSEHDRIGGGLEAWGCELSHLEQISSASRWGIFKVASRNCFCLPVLLCLSLCWIRCVLLGRWWIPGLWLQDIKPTETWRFEYCIITWLYRICADQIETSNPNRDCTIEDELVHP